MFDKSCPCVLGMRRCSTWNTVSPGCQGKRTVTGNFLCNTGRGVSQGLTGGARVCKGILLTLLESRWYPQIMKNETTAQAENPSVVRVKFESGQHPGEVAK